MSKKNKKAKRNIFSVWIKKWWKWLCEQCKIVLWKKVLLNIFMTAVIPIILFTLPVIASESVGSIWGKSILFKLQQGALFSSVISIASGMVISFQPRFKSSYVDLLKGNKSGDDLLPIYINFTVIVTSFIVMLLAAYYYGQLGAGSSLNIWGIGIEIILFLFIQILYGYTEGLLATHRDVEPQDLVGKSDTFNSQAESQENEDLAQISRKLDREKILGLRNNGGKVNE